MLLKFFRQLFKEIAWKYFTILQCISAFFENFAKKYDGSTGNYPRQNIWEIFPKIFSEVIPKMFHTFLHRILQKCPALNIAFESKTMYPPYSFFLEISLGIPLKKITLQHVITNSSKGSFEDISWNFLPKSWKFYIETIFENQK